VSESDRGGVMLWKRAKLTLPSFSLRSAQVCRLAVGAMVQREEWGGEREQVSQRAKRAANEASASEAS